MTDHTPHSSVKHFQPIRHTITQVLERDTTLVGVMGFLCGFWLVTLWTRGPLLFKGQPPLLGNLAILLAGVDTLISLWLAALCLVAWGLARIRAAWQQVAEAAEAAEAEIEDLANQIAGCITQAMVVPNDMQGICYLVVRDAHHPAP